jgi:excisionase family DNA binding protein
MKAANNHAAHARSSSPARPRPSSVAPAKPALATPIKSPNGAPDQILTVPMLAEYLLCHPSTIYRLLKNKRIPGFRVGSDWRFRKSAIDQWLNKATIASGRI